MENLKKDFLKFGGDITILKEFEDPDKAVLITDMQKRIFEIKQGNNEIPEANDLEMSFQKIEKKKYDPTANLINHSMEK